MSEVRRDVLVLGLGGQGRRAARWLEAQGALSAVSDVDAAALTHPGVPAERAATTDALAAIQAAETRRVVLACPGATHEGLIESALRAGRAVWVPCPPPIPAARLDALHALARAQGVALCDTPTRVFEPAVELFIRTLDAWRDAAATLVEVEVRAPAPAPMEPDARFALPSNEAITALALLGASGAPEQVEGFAVRSAHSLDHVAARWLGAGGQSLRLTLSRLPAPPALVARAHGATGSLTLTLDLDADAGASASARLECAGEGVPLPEPTAEGAGYTRALAAFLRGERLSAPLAARLEGARAAFAHLSARLVADAPRPGGPVLHPTVALDGDVPAIKIGEGTRIWHFSKLIGPCEVGARCSLGQNVVVERHVRVGDNVKIQNNVSLYEGVELEDDVFCGPSMVFTNIGTPRSAFPRKGQYTRTLVKRGASIGANATVVCGHTLGRCCFVGAAAVVTRDVPDYALVYGNPARVQGFACWCGVKLPFGHDTRGEERATCAHCGRGYARSGHTVRSTDDRPDA